MKPEALKEIEQIRKKSKLEVLISLLKEEIEAKPERRKIYKEGYQILATVFPEGSEERENCLKVAKAL